MIGEDPRSNIYFIINEIQNRGFLERESGLKNRTKE